jgi:hypothetical protein
MLWGIAIITIGALMSSRGYDRGLLTPTEKDAFVSFDTHHPKLRKGEAPLYYPTFSGPVYSLEIFIPLVKFGQEDRWAPNAQLGTPVLDGWNWTTTGWLLRLYLWFEAAAGWLLSTFFVAGLTPIVRSR